jgi:hypothetical protein
MDKARQQLSSPPSSASAVKASLAAKSGASGKDGAVNPLRSTQSMDGWGYFRLACISLACVFILLH